MRDYRPVTYFAFSQTSKDAVNLVRRIDFELWLHLAHGYESENVGTQVFTMEHLTP